ncbi:3620_t:CDS:1, partial [Acaulospora colombiana]
LTEDWKEEYRPKDYIKELWYKDFLKPISQAELGEILQTLPNNKALGQLQINYKIFKKLSQDEKKILKRILNNFLRWEVTSTCWKQSYIYPIAKPKP